MKTYMGNIEEARADAALITDERYAELRAMPKFQMLKLRAADQTIDHALSGRRLPGSQSLRGTPGASPRESAQAQAIDYAAALSPPAHRLGRRMLLRKLFRSGKPLHRPRTGARIEKGETMDFDMKFDYLQEKLRGNQEALEALEDLKRAAVRAVGGLYHASNSRVLAYHPITGNLNKGTVNYCNLRRVSIEFDDGTNSLIPNENVTPIRCDITPAGTAW